MFLSGHGVCVGRILLLFLFLCVSFSSVDICLYVVSTSGRCSFRPPCHAAWRMRGHVNIKKKKKKKGMEPIWSAVFQNYI